MPYDVDKLIATARKRKAAAQQHDAHNREEQKTDLQYLVGNQWPEKAVDDRAANDLPSLTINMLPSFTRQVTNEIRQNNPAVKVKPRQGGSKDTAEVLEGMARAIQYASDSSNSFVTAATYAVSSGFGAFQMIAEQVDEDQNLHEIRLEAIHDPSTLFCDPNAKKQDRSDARWWIKVNIISRIEFAERWPKAESIGSDFVGDSDWMDPKGDSESVMVAEYWVIEQAGSSAVALGDEMADNLKRTRRNRNHEVVKHIINGVEELEEPVIVPGDWIPIFPVYGEETWVDGKCFIGSLIRDARDVQTLYNWEATEEAVTLARHDSTPWIVTPKMVEGFEDDYRDANQKLHAYLKYNPDTLVPGGKPERANSEPAIAAISQAKAQTAAEMRTIIGIHESAMGKQQYAGQSGNAIGQLRSESDTSTFHYQDNLARTMRHWARVLLQWIPYYYDVEQEVNILGPDMAEKIVRVNTDAPFTDPVTGKTYHHQLDKGKYEAAVKVEPNAGTKREESAAFYTSVIGAVPEAMMVIGDLLFANSDSEGADAAADRWKRFIAMKSPGLIQDDQSQIPPAAQAQIAQLTQQLQQLQQALQQAGMIIKTKQVEGQTRIQVEQIKGQVAVEKAKLDLHGKVLGATLDHHAANFKTHLQALVGAAEHMLDMFHESEMAPDPNAQPSPNGASAGTP